MRSHPAHPEVRHQPSETLSLSLIGRRFERHRQTRRRRRVTTRTDSSQKRSSMGSSILSSRNVAGNTRMDLRLKTAPPMVLVGIAARHPPSPTPRVPIVPKQPHGSLPSRQSVSTREVSRSLRIPFTSRSAGGQSQSCLPPRTRLGFRSGPALLLEVGACSRAENRG